MRVLHLTLHRRWFDAIARGEKKEEYRAITDYWRNRLEGRTYDEVHFRNGYNPASPWMRVEFLGIRTGEWEGRAVFVIALGDILEVRHWLSTIRPASSPNTPLA